MNPNILILSKNGNYVNIILQGSGFADGRSETSPDSEQIERNARRCKERNSVSVEQIQEKNSLSKKKLTANFISDLGLVPD